VSADLLDVEEAAEYLTVSRATLYRLIRDKKIQSVKMVVGTRIERKELDRYLLANSRTGPGELYIPPRFTLYRFYNVAGDLLYVGITGYGAQRWTNHSRYQPWWLEVATVKVEHFASLADVSAAEVNAIVHEAPRYNVRHQP
jgi:excisionase family DNA binding protein